jgi:hypothetical protein
MIRCELDKSEYYDFVLTDDCNISYRDLSKNKKIEIDFIDGLCNKITGDTEPTGYTGPTGDTEPVILNNISLTGYDNQLLSGDTIDYVKYNVKEKFCFHEINEEYIEKKVEDGYIKLNGGFYQGFFKLFDYPIEFLEPRMKKGWTVDMLLHLPITSGGTIFYMGTSAEQKYTNLTEEEVQILQYNLKIEFKDVTRQFSNNLFWQLTGVTDNSTGYTGYTGYYDIKNGIPYIYNTNTKLYYKNDYKDLINNAFCIYIDENGCIGYKNIISTNKCETQEYLLDDPFKYITIETGITEQIIDTTATGTTNDRFINLTIIFERDFEYKDKCELKTGDYKKGVLKILINGFVVHRFYDFTEIIPHELDNRKEFQEGVPYNISIGGGTLGLSQAKWIDQEKLYFLSDEFGKPFDGGVRSFDFYDIPLYVTEIRDIISKKNIELEMPQKNKMIKRF